MPGDFAAQTHFPADLGERAVVIVVKEQVETEVSNEDIGVAVVVEVGYGYAGSPVRIRQAGADADIFEMAVAEVVVQVQASFPRGRDAAGDDATEIVDCGTVDDQQIHQRVAMEIEPRRAGTVRLRNPFLFGTSAADLSANAALRSDVYEAHGCIGNSAPG